MNSKTLSSSIKGVAEEYANKVWNDKEIGAIDKCVHEEVIIHSPLGDFHGIKALKDVVQAWWKGFPDLRVDNDVVISENDIVSILWTAKGTHQGDFKGRKPTGKTVSYSGVTIYRIRNSKIVEYWAYLDMQHLLGQI